MYIQKHNDNHKAFDNYIEGNMDSKEAQLFLKRLQEEDDFYEDFRLWIKIDKWLDEITFVEIEQTIDTLGIKERKSTINPTKLVLRGVLKFAALLIFVGSFSFYFYKRFYDLDKLQGTFSYEAKLFINSDGLSENKNYLITKRLDWEVIKSKQKDTTYLFIENEGMPPTLMIQVPKINIDFNRKTKIYFNDSLHKFVIIFNKKEYLLEKSQKWEKLKEEL